MKVIECCVDGKKNLINIDKVVRIYFEPLYELMEKNYPFLKDKRGAYKLEVDEFSLPVFENNLRKNNVKMFTYEECKKFFLKYDVLIKTEDELLCIARETNYNYEIKIKEL